MLCPEDTKVSMPFVDDPNALRVIDPRNGNSLKVYVRDVPLDEMWFTFVFQGAELIAKAKFSASKESVSTDGSQGLEKFKFVFNVGQLGRTLRDGFARREVRCEPSATLLHEEVLPTLRDAVIALMDRRLLGSASRPTRKKRFFVEVKFVDPTQGD